MTKARAGLCFLINSNPTVTKLFRNILLLLNLPHDETTPQGFIKTWESNLI